MTTQTLVTCNGKINQHGFCDKCYQPAHTTSNQCGRLVPYQQAEINTVLAVSGHDKFSKQAITEFVISELCDFDDESGRYFREDTVISLLHTYLSAAGVCSGQDKTT